MAHGLANLPDEELKKVKVFAQSPLTQADSPASLDPVKIQSFSHPLDQPLMTKNPPVTIHRKDYTAPAYWVNTVEMGFDLDPAATRVATRITLQRNSASPNKDVELLGDGAKLVALRMNGKTLRKGAPGKNYTKSKGSASHLIFQPTCPFANTINSK